MVSLVTACKNREQHLRRSLPHWLGLAGIDEVIVVDWSNDRPLDDLRDLDPRVRIVRVTDEPRWILSYAYNIGVRHATKPLILKCDADCLPQASLLQLTPDAAHFRAGHWRSGSAVGKPSVNGQCFFSKDQFEAVNGYSEIIRTYGRDDEDFYDRLIAAGFAREEITPDLLDFIDHTQEERVSNQFDVAPASNVAARIERDPLYNEMRNAYLAHASPWGVDRRRATFTTVQEAERLTVLTRDTETEIVLPADLLAEARLFSLRHIAGQLTGLPEVKTRHLNERACLTVIGARLNQRRAA